MAVAVPALQTARKKPLHQALLVFPQGRCFCFLRFDALVKGRKTVGYFLLFGEGWIANFELINFFKRYSCYCLAKHRIFNNFFELFR